MDTGLSWEFIIALLGTAFFEYIKQTFLFIRIEEMEPPPPELQRAVLALLDSEEKTDMVLQQLRQIESETQRRNLDRKREAEERTSMLQNDSYFDERRMESKRRNENVLNQLRQIETETKDRNQERRRESSERQMMSENDFSDARIFKVNTVKAKYDQVLKLEENLEDQIELFTTDFLNKKNTENALETIRSMLPNIKFMTQAGIPFSKKSEMLTDSDVIDLFKRNRVIYKNSPIQSFEIERLFEFIRSL
jgi:hypothetical protein